MNRVKVIAALFVAFLAPAALTADYEITLRGGVRYWSHRKPSEKKGAYVFTATDGTLLSVRKGDVASIRSGDGPKPETTVEPVGGTSLAAAARNQRAVAQKIHERPRDVPQNSDAYRPGVGVPLPAGSNDYVVGKTWAPPPGNTVYSGAAPTGVPSGDAPKGAPSGDAPKGAPATDAPKGAPSRDAPKGAPASDAPIGAPEADAVPPPPPPPPRLPVR